MTYATLNDPEIILDLPVDHLDAAILLLGSRIGLPGGLSTAEWRREIMGYPRVGNGYIRYNSAEHYIFTSCRQPGTWPGPTLMPHAMAAAWIGAFESSHPRTYEIWHARLEKSETAEILMRAFAELAMRWER